MAPQIHMETVVPLTLFGNSASPFARKAMVVLHESGQAGAVQLRAVAGSTLDSGSIPLADNPLGKIPFLSGPEGLALYDSRVICRYLATRAGSAIYPCGPDQWSALTAEALADGILDAALAIVYEQRLRPPEIRSSAITEGQQKRILRAVAAIRPDDTDGPAEIGGIATGVALEYLDFRLPDIPWRDAAPELGDWLDAYAQRPAMRATRPNVPWPGE